MKSVIDSLYYCDRVYYEELNDLEESRAAKAEFDAAYDRLLMVIPKEVKDRLDEMILLHSKIADANFAKKFNDGFKLGFKIASEMNKE